MLIFVMLYQVLSENLVNDCSMDLLSIFAISIWAKFDLSF